MHEGGLTQALMPASALQSEPVSHYEDGGFVPPPDRPVTGADHTVSIRSAARRRVGANRRQAGAANAGPGASTPDRSRNRRRSWALAATTIVDRLIASAPTLIGRTKPMGVSRPAAAGMVSRATIQN